MSELERGPQASLPEKGRGTNEPILPTCLDGNEFKGIASAKFPKESIDILMADADTDDVAIRPDGIIYLPGAFYRLRLNMAFGPGAWGMWRKALFIKDKMLFFHGYLIINERYVSDAIGEAKMSSDQTSYAGYVEQATTDCITRCCKNLSVAWKLWDPKFIRNWKEEFAVQVWCKNKKTSEVSPRWRRKDQSPIAEYPWFEDKGNAPSGDDKKANASNNKGSNGNGKAQAPPKTKNQSPAQPAAAKEPKAADKAAPAPAPGEEKPIRSTGEAARKVLFLRTCDQWLGKFGEIPGGEGQYWALIKAAGVEQPEQINEPKAWLSVESGLKKVYARLQAETEAALCN